MNGQGMIGQKMQQNAPPQPQQQGRGNVYPANKKEVQQFITDLMQALYQEKQVDQLVGMLSQGKDNISETVGALAGQLVMTIVQRRQQQTGRKPHINLVIRGLQMVIKNIAQIVETAGIGKLEQRDLQNASMVAGRMVEKTMGGGQQQQQPQQAPPQGGMV